MRNPLLNVGAEPMPNPCQTYAKPMCFQTPLYPHALRTPLGGGARNEGRGKGWEVGRYSQPEITPFFDGLPFAT